MRSLHEKRSLDLFRVASLATLVVAASVVACTGNVGDGSDESSGSPAESASAARRPPSLVGQLVSAAPQNGSPSSPSPAPTTSPSSPSGSGSSSGSGAPPSAPPGKTGLLVGYYASWTRATMPPSSIPWDRVTHISHAFVQPTSSGGLASIASYVDTELLSQAHAHGVKVVAAVGGAGASFGAMVDPAARAATVSDLASLCRSYGYDGVDVDWEFPDASNVSAWASLLSELRVALDAVRPGLSISAAIGAGAQGDVLPVDALNALTWIGAMTYDYAGDWSATSGHVAPLYPSSGGDGGSVSLSIQHLLARGVAANKLMIGLPFYGAEMGAQSLASTPVAPATAPDYRDVVALPASDGWTTQWDATAQVPYLTRAASPGFLSYDDAKSIAAKCAFEKSQSLGGAIVWHLAGDRLADGSDPLLDAAQACR